MNRIEEMIRELCPEGIVYEKLGAICFYPKERIAYSKLSVENYVSTENLLKDKKGKINAASIPNEGMAIEFCVGDILIGNIRPYLKKIWLADCCGGTNGDVLLMRIRNQDLIISKFLYYILSSDAFFNFDNQYAKGAKMPRGDKNKVMEFMIPVPPLAIQNEIVNILDKFTELEAELEARRKQYEYYRNKLLNFSKFGGGILKV